MSVPKASTTARMCPIPGCDGSGNRRLGSRGRHYSWAGCPNVKQLVANKSQAKRRCPVVGCNGSGNVRPCMKYHTSWSGCPLAITSKKVKRKLKADVESKCGDSGVSDGHNDNSGTQFGSQFGPQFGTDLALNSQHLCTRTQCQTQSDSDSKSGETCLNDNFYLVNDEKQTFGDEKKLCFEFDNSKCDLDIDVSAPENQMSFFRLIFVGNGSANLSVTNN